MTDRTYLVTGVSRGLGTAIAERLIRNGAVVYGLARRRSEQTEKLEEIAGDQFHFKEVDLAATDSLEDSVFRDWIGFETVLHGVVNNAAVAYDDLATNLDLAALENQFRVNVFAAMVVARGGIRNFLFHRTPGSLVHVSSVCTRTGYKGLSFYGASKAALEGFSINLAREWGARGIRSNCIAAGFMETDMSAGLKPQVRERIYRRTSLGRAVEVEKVAASVEFLLSEGSGATTGEVMRVDNGTL